MRLPNNEVGISDIKQWRECPRRFEFGMRRHVEDGEPPEDMHPDTLYGTVFHDMVEKIEELDLDDDAALQQAFDEHAVDLDPTYYEMLKWDLRTYRERDLTGVRTVANESEVRIPLLDWPCFTCEGKGTTIVQGSKPDCCGNTTDSGECRGDCVVEVPTEEEDACPECGGKGEVTIYFRGRIDRLYQSLTEPGKFFHRDYKTSKHRKAEDEVHSDEQMWAYNWAIHEWWPECEDLEQEFDQLRFGLVRTRKSAEQREHIRQWLVRQVTAILKAEGPKPRINQWCAWCPIKESCSEVDRLHQFETARINFLAKTLPEASEDPEMEFLPTYIEKLPDVQQAIKLLKAYEASVKEVLKELPEDRREALGWDLSSKRTTVFSTDALRDMHEILGDDLFYEVVNATQTNVKAALKGDERLEQIMGLSHKQPGAQVLTHRGEA